MTDGVDQNSLCSIEFDGHFSQERFVLISQFMRNIFLFLNKKTEYIP